MEEKFAPDIILHKSIASLAAEAPRPPLGKTDHISRRVFSTCVGNWGSQENLSNRPQILWLIITPPRGAAPLKASGHAKSSVSIILKH